MLQQMTIVTDNRSVLEPLVRSALDHEKKMIALGLERTRNQIAKFEQRFQMTSDDFERRLNDLELDETIEFTDWRMEIGMLRLLEREFKALNDARLD